VNVAPDENPAAISLASFAYDAFDRTVQDDPYPYYQILRDHYPVYHNAKRDYWTLSRYADVRDAARDWKTFSNRRGVELDAAEDVYPDTFGPGIVINYDPPTHDRLRKVVHRQFTPKSVRSLEGSIRSFVSELLDDLAEQDRPDLATDFAWRLPVTTISHILGFPRADRERLQAWMFELEARPVDEDLFEMPESALAAASDLAAYIRESLEIRRGRPTGDLLSDLVAAEEDGRLEHGEARGLTFILVLAGIDTTACLLSNGLHRMAGRQDDRAWLLAEPSRFTPFVEEVVRYEAPVAGLARVTNHEVTMHGTTIPANASVWLSYAAANRDDRRFSDPDTLDVRRPPSRHLGFGEGIHHCIGAPLARLEGRVAFEAFFRRFPAYQITGPQERLHQHTTRGWVRLHAALR
jgi:cytochrome P450